MVGLLSTWSQLLKFIWQIVGFYNVRLIYKRSLLTSSSSQNYLNVVVKGL